MRSAEFGVRRARQRRPPGLFSGEPEATGDPEETATAKKAGTGDVGRTQRGPGGQGEAGGCIGRTCATGCPQPVMPQVIDVSWLTRTLRRRGLNFRIAQGGRVG